MSNDAAQQAPPLPTPSAAQALLMQLVNVAAYIAVHLQIGSFDAELDTLDKLERLTKWIQINIKAYKEVKNETAPTNR